MEILDGPERQILATARALAWALDEELAPLGITCRQAQVLGHLLRAGPLCQADLARHFGLKPPTLCGILRRMEHAGWIELVACPGDRRRVSIWPTAKARAAQAALDAGSGRVVGRATRGLTDSQVEALLATLKAIRDRLPG